MLVYMAPHLSADRSGFSTPAIYRIRVLGRVKPGWSSRLAGMAISLSAPGDTAPVTTLVGELPDQDALTVLLNKLYDLQFTILSVERVA